LLQTFLIYIERDGEVGERERERDLTGVLRCKMILLIRTTFSWDRAESMEDYWLSVLIQIKISVLNLFLGSVK
jgi:hypothetical protein